MFCFIQILNVLHFDSLASLRGVGIYHHYLEEFVF